MIRTFLLLATIIAICTAAVILYAGVGTENVEKTAPRIPDVPISPSTSNIRALTVPALSSLPGSVDIPHIPNHLPKRLIVAAAVIHKIKAAPLLATSGAPSRNFIEPTTGMEFLPVPGGCFQMGDSSGDTDEKPVHQVCLDSFFVGKFEVTQGHWLKVMGSQPSFFSSCGINCPVENVSWNETQEFIGKLNRLNGINYRLMTEAEWEYACRSGGKSELFCGGSDVDAVAWHDKNSSSKPHQVGEKRPNGLGIYDMGGNVWEWVGDLYLKDYYGTIQGNNPEGPVTGSKRVLRGGSWYNDVRNVRASIRGCDDPDHRSINLGFRLAYSAR